MSKGTEFGYIVRIDEKAALLLAMRFIPAIPRDDDLLVSTVEAHKKRFGAAPKAVATDRGFSSKKNETALTEMGVGRISLPCKGKKDQARTEHENQDWFKDLQRYRAAGEAKISLLKRKYSLNRSRYRGLAGSKSWIGFGILTHNLQRAAKMLESEAK